MGVVLIWATTPLAIKWSSEGAGFLFGVASRMLLGVLVCLTLITLVTPVLALLLGQDVNGEIIGARELLGTSVILTGLACYQWGDR